MKSFLRRLRFEHLETRALLTTVGGDFNGDGRDDLSIGAISESIGDVPSAGGVNIIYGRNSNGLSGLNSQFWSQNSSGIDGVAEANEQFGSALAVGDFNGDGFDDLAIGVPGDKVGGVAAGSVNVLYGSATGLRNVGDQLWNQNSSTVQNTAEEGDRFGAALTAGDFNNDGRDDLAIGVPGEDASMVEDFGMVQILFGSSTGLTATNNQLFHQNTSGVDDSIENEDQFGARLVAGDFNNDNRDDLAISAFREDFGAVTNVGVVHVLYGRSTGLSGSGDQLFSQDTTGIADTAEGEDQFGDGLAAGDFNGDGTDDLAIGASQENDVISLENINGKVHVLFGSAAKLSGTGSQLFTRLDFAGMANNENFTGFGRVLVAANFNGDNRDDLAIGLPNSHLNGINAGAVAVMYGTNAGLSATGAQVWTESAAGIEEGDHFGAALTAGDYDNDGRDDLAIGVPYEDFSFGADAGCVHVLYGSNAGLSTVGFQRWTQISSGLTGDGEAVDDFGFALA